MFFDYTIGLTSQMCFIYLLNSYILLTELHLTPAHKVS